jgi:hypothetical protein
MAQPVEIFYCYARANEDALLSLQKVLKPLERLKLIQPWHSRQIMPGATVAQEIEAHLDQAQVIILLLSPEFLESDYCCGVKMERVLQLHREARVHLVPVLLHPCLWDVTSLQGLQSLPDGGIPISEWPNQAAAWHDVAVNIHALVREIQAVAEQESELNTNTPKTRRKSREPTRTKRKQTSEGAVKAKGTRTARTTRTAEVPAPELSQNEQDLAEALHPATQEGDDAKPRYKDSYGKLQEKIRRVRFKILVWEPSLPTEGIVVEERRNIYNSLEAEKHQCWLGKQLQVPPGASLQDREVEQAFKSDLTVLLVEPPALGEMHEFCKHEGLLGNTLIFYPAEMKSAPEDWGLDRKLSIAYRHLDYYQEIDLIQCNVRMAVLNWARARRSLRFSNKSRSRR